MEPATYLTIFNSAQRRNATADNNALQPAKKRTFQFPPFEGSNLWNLYRHRELQFHSCHWRRIHREKTDDAAAAVTLEMIQHLNIIDLPRCHISLREECENTFFSYPAVGLIPEKLEKRSNPALP